MKTQKTYYVYITASKRNGTLYIGVTSNLKKRILVVDNLELRESVSGFLPPQE